jgi:hypothetical protein
MTVARFDYQITVVNWRGRWRHATAPNLVKLAGVPPKIAARWAAIRREMSPSGLKKKLKAQVN